MGESTKLYVVTAGLLCDTTPDGDMSDMDTTWFETPQELLECFCYEIHNDIVYGGDRLDAETITAECIRIAMEALNRMDGNTRSKWMPVMLAYYDNMDSDALDVDD